MDRKRFWEIIMEAATYKMDKHAEIAKADGPSAADEEFGMAVSASNMMVSFSSKFDTDDKLQIALEHCAYAVTALWLDFENEGVEDVKTIRHDDVSDRGVKLN